MKIGFNKDSRTPVLTCVRKDGSITYTKTRPGNIFPCHDLIHCAVETTLGVRKAFFGLISDWWSIDNFSEQSTLKRLPYYAHYAEFLVGQLDLEYQFGERSNTQDSNETIRAP